HLAETFNVKSKISENTSVISPIGVALAMVRDMVERTIPSPTEEDIISVRREAVRMATKSGANPDTIEVKVEVDTQRQVVRAIAIGTTEFRTKELTQDKKSMEELRTIVGENLGVDPSELKVEADNGSLIAFTC